MNLKLWALNVCVVCILAGALDLFLPRQGSFKSIKTVLALYILVSGVTPATGVDWTGLAGLSFEASAQPADYSDFVSSYACESLARQLEDRLAADGIQAQVEIRPGTDATPPAVTLCTDQPQEALKAAKDFLDGAEYAWETAQPQA